MCGSISQENSSTSFLHHGLWDCLINFSGKIKNSKTIYKKQIWIFTNDDDPESSLSRSEQQRTIEKVNQLKSAKLEISLWCVNKIGKIFDPTKFYDKIVSTKNDLDIEDNEDFVEAYDEYINYANDNKFDELSERTRRKAFKKRVLCSIPLRITSDFSIR